jgi:hypothetical protein
VRVKGRSAYVYRALDKDGQVIDVVLRDLASAKAFLAQAIERRGVTPAEVITDGHQAAQRAVREAAPAAVLCRLRASSTSWTREVAGTATFTSYRCECTSPAAPITFPDHGHCADEAHHLVACSGRDRLAGSQNRRRGGLHAAGVTRS